jgi:hypothetical protein
VDGGFHGENFVDFYCEKQVVEDCVFEVLYLVIVCEDVRNDSIIPEIIWRKRIVSIRAVNDP